MGFGDGFIRLKTKEYIGWPLLARYQKDAPSIFSQHKKDAFKGKMDHSS
jgi:hypothetical protein